MNSTAGQNKTEFKKPSLGLALSGGGTRGLVHVGVLQALEEHDIRPSIISGTSAGSIVGALYVHGYSPAEIRELAYGQRLTRVLSLKVPYSGFVRHTFLRKLLEKLLPSNDFSNCSIPFKVAIANLNSGKVEVYDEGPLIDYVIASSSVPVLFEPVEIGDNRYVDGGLLMNLPASPIKEDCDVLIGVNLVPLTPVPKSQLKSVLSIGTRCFDLAALNNIMPQFDYCDLVIDPKEINDYSRFNFSQLEEMYDIGYREAMKHMDTIKSMLAPKD